MCFLLLRVCSQKQLCANCGVAWHAGMTCQQYQVCNSKGLCARVLGCLPAQPGGTTLQSRSGAALAPWNGPIKCPLTTPATKVHSSMQAQPDALRSKEDQALLDLAEQEGMRRCPACGAMVMRTEVSAGEWGVAAVLIQGVLVARDACPATGLVQVLCVDGAVGTLRWPCCGWRLAGCAVAQLFLPAFLPPAGLLLHDLPLRQPLLLRLRQAEGER